MSLTNQVDESNGGGRSVAATTLPRNRFLSDSSDERQRYVARVLDLLQIAETGLLDADNRRAIVDALRSISAVKAISAFLNQSAVAGEATLIIERSERMGTLGESDRGWLLIAVDRLRLLAVDPHHSSTPKTLLTPVAMAHLERLTTVVEQLSACLARHPDHEVATLLAELRASSKLLLRIPVAPLVTRLQAHAIRFNRLLTVRGDDLALAAGILHLLEKILPSLITAAAGEANCASGLTMVFIEQGRELVVRLACDCVVSIPEGITKALHDIGSLAQDDGIITIRLSYDALADNRGG